MDKGRGIVQGEIEYNGEVVNCGLIERHNAMLRGAALRALSANRTTNPRLSAASPGAHCYA